MPCTYRSSGTRATRLLSIHGFIRISGVLSLPQRLWLYLDIVLVISVAKMWFWGTLGFIFVGWFGFKRRRRLRKSLLYLICPIVLAWLCLASASYSQQICGPEKSKYCGGGDFKGFFLVDTAKHRVVDQGYEDLYKTLRLLLFLVPITILYIILTVPDGLEWDLVEFSLPNWQWINRTTAYLDKVLSRRKASVGNAVSLLVIFIIYLVGYDASKSWVELWILEEGGSRKTVCLGNEPRTYTPITLPGFIVPLGISELGLFMQQHESNYTFKYFDFSIAVSRLRAESVLKQHNFSLCEKAWIF